MDTLENINLLGLDMWVWMTLLAATAQTFRSLNQKKMKPILGDNGASYIRFSYALPFAWLWVITYQTINGLALPSPPLTFWFWLCAASLMQVLFTVFLIRMFSHRSFAAGTAFSKTEVLQVAIFEALILGAVASAFTTTAIILGAIAVVMLSLAKTNFNRNDIITTLTSKQTAMGLLAGATLGLSTVFFKGAILTLGGSDFLLIAGYTSATAVTVQTICMGGWMYFSSARDELLLSFIHWRASLRAGFYGALATAAWFTAFALYSVAPVRAVGQVELLFTLGVSVFYFKERINKAESIAIILLVISIIMILLDGRQA
jgi:drug/metabolite transporter (DMT)-like permease